MRQLTNEEEKVGFFCWFFFFFFWLAVLDVPTQDQEVILLWVLATVANGNGREHMAEQTACARKKEMRGPKSYSPPRACSNILKTFPSL